MNPADAQAFLAYVQRKAPLADDVADRVFAAVMAYWRRIHGKRGYSADLFDDCSATAWLKLLKHGTDIRDLKALNAWSNAVFVNCVLDELRAMQRRPRTGMAEIEESAEPLFVNADRALDAEQLREQSERERVNAELVQQLSGRRRAIFEMKYWQELSYAEIAAKLGCTENSVRSVVSRTKITLKAIAGSRTPNG